MIGYFGEVGYGRKRTWPFFLVKFDEREWCKMALVKYGGGIIQMSGAIAGNVFARNHYGNYVRARTKPVNPNSPGQVAVRAALDALVQRWSVTLTPVQRAAWNLYGSNVAMKNKLGESVFLTGFNHYVRSNTAFKRQLNLQQDAGPVVFELPAADALFAMTASEAVQQVSITFDALLPWASEDGAGMLIYQGTPQNAQRNFFAGPWRSISAIWGNFAAPPASPFGMAIDFPIAAGQRQWIYARIRRADGRISTPFRADVLVAA